MVRVDLERCTGCGICADYCHVKAIRIIDARAAIDNSLCDQCEACISACPQGALSSVPEALSISRVRTLSQLRPAPLITVPPARRIGTAWQGRLLPLLGAVASLAASEFVPRVVDALVRTIARQSAAPRLASDGRGLRFRRRGRF
jgi:Pyruvate/2-oxoacid:ferredoxin oxidoreductase delta subunit